MFAFWRLPSGRLCLGLLAFLVVLDVAAWSRSAIEFGAHNFEPILYLLVLTTMVAAAGCYLYCRVPQAEWLGKSLICLSTSVSVLGCYNTAALFGTYYAADLRMPFQDDALVAFDHLIGFDWTALLVWSNGHPVVAHALCWAYLSMLPQMLAVLICFAYSRERDKAWDFLAMCALTLLVTVVVSSVAPVVSAYTVHAPKPEMYAALEAIIPDVGRDFVAHVMALHNGTFQRFDVMEMTGIVGFPSYHTIVGCIVIATAIERRFLVWPAIALNGAMIVSTIPVGGHHLAETFAGIAVFFACRLAMPWLTGERSWKLAPFAAARPAVAPAA